MRPAVASLALIGAAWGVTLSALLFTLPAHAQATKDAIRTNTTKPLSQSLTGPAKADFDAAKLLANDGDFAGALIKFQSAYDVSKDWRLLWNVAFCQKNLRHYSKVVTILRRYVEEGGAALLAHDKKDALDLIATIEPFTTRVTFHVSEEGAQIFVDDEIVGTSPASSPAVLDIGERRLRVVKDGFRTYERALAVGGSAEVTTEVLLEKEVHEGKLIVEASTAAAIFVDDKQIGTGKVEETIPSGGHQLRVTAPGMRPYQTEIVVRDKETRSLNVVLEAEAQAEKPKLRVSVGCADPEPRGPEDGLVVYVDGPDVLAPGPVKRRWSADLGKNVVEYVEYPIAAGAHALRLRINDCQAMDQQVSVDSTTGAGVSGALPSDRFILFRGPQGSPGWFRAALGMWFPGGGSLKESVPESYGSSVFGVTGAALDVGIVDRWFGLYVNAAYGSGSFRRNSFNTHYALPDPANSTWERLQLRFGPRFPFNIVALGLGVSFGIAEIDVDALRTGKPEGVGGAFGELDIQPLCDWGLFAMGSGEKPTSNDDAYAALQFGVFFEPNSRCRVERGTKLGLHTPP